MSDQSAVLVKAGTLTLANPTITKSGDTKSSDESSFYGLNAGVLAENGGDVVIDGGTVATTATGANAVFAYGSGSSATVTDAKITATAQYAHGVMASGGGTLVVRDSTVTTTGANGAPIATDRGGGTVTVSGTTLKASGQDSPGIYSTGKITVSDSTVYSAIAQGAVVEGNNSITVTGSTISGTDGVWLHQSGSGDAESGSSVFTMTGGSLTARTGDAFQIKNTKATIVIKGVTVKNAADVLDSTDGSSATLTAIGEKLSGNVVADSTSTAAIALTKGSTLSATVTKAAVTLDSTSTWTVTANSTVTSLVGATVSGSSITNITGNGHTVYYDKSLAANSYLDGKTYTLAGGGTLVAK